MAFAALRRRSQDDMWGYTPQTLWSAFCANHEPPTGMHCSLCLSIPPTRGCIRREGTSEAAPEAVGQAVGGGCQIGWGRLLSATNAIEAGTWRQGDSGWA